MENLVENHTYLVRYGSQYTLFSITILMITNTSYHIRWNNELKSTNAWEMIDRFQNEYHVVEDITNFIQEPIASVTCPHCYGVGTVPDNQSTSGVKMCPRCFGSKRIYE